MSRIAIGIIKQRIAIVMFILSTAIVYPIILMIFEDFPDKPSISLTRYMIHDALPGMRIAIISSLFVPTFISICAIAIVGQKQILFAAISCTMSFTIYYGIILLSDRYTFVTHGYMMALSIIIGLLVSERVINVIFNYQIYRRQPPSYKLRTILFAIYTVLPIFVFPYFMKQFFLFPILSLPSVSDISEYGDISFDSLKYIIAVAVFTAIYSLVFTISFVDANRAQFLAFYSIISFVMFYVVFYTDITVRSILHIPSNVGCSQASSICVLRVEQGALIAICLSLSAVITVRFFNFVGKATLTDT